MENKIQNKSVTKEKKLVGEYYRYSGPLPHPNLLNQFDKKTRDKIVGMAVDQSAHRQSIEKTVVKSNSRNELLGITASLFLTLIMILTGSFLVYSDKQIIGFLTIFTPAVFQAKNYYHQRNSEKNISKSKNK